jgi:large conductance mechanosensitive channel
MAGFKAFVARGNVLDLAVAVIIGAAFATIVSSLTDDIIMPVVGALTGGIDFSSYYLRLGPIPDGYAGPASYAAFKAAGVPMLGYGQFLTTVVNFLILAFVIYRMVKAAQRVIPADEPATPLPSEEVLLLREIRDALKAPRAAPATSAVDSANPPS